MIFATYSATDGSERVGVVSKDKQKIIPLESLGYGGLTMLELIEFYSNLSADDPLKNGGSDTKKLQSDGIPISSVRLLAPIPKPRHDIICVGLNYSEHTKESANFTKPAENPTFFTKRVILPVGHGDAIPAHAELTSQLDYESELAVIIGKRCHNVSEQDADKYIFGYTVANDVSARDLQFSYGQWFFGKGLDGFAPIGPWIVTADEFAASSYDSSGKLSLRISSKVNGELRQDSNTGDMIFSIPFLISVLSRGITLEPGDIIMTGTPSGVGMGFSPPKYLKPGDVVECEIEGIGVLRNTIE